MVNFKDVMEYEPAKIKGYEFNKHKFVTFKCFTEDETESLNYEDYTYIDGLNINKKVSMNFFNKEYFYHLPRDLSNNFLLFKHIRKVTIPNDAIVSCYYNPDNLKILRNTQYYTDKMILGKKISFEDFFSVQSEKYIIGQ